MGNFNHVCRTDSVLACCGEMLVTAAGVNSAVRMGICLSPSRVWSGRLIRSQIRAIEKIQMRATEMIEGMSYIDYGERLNTIQWLPSGASGNKIDNIMVVIELIIFCTIKNHSNSPNYNK